MSRKLLFLLSIMILFVVALVACQPTEVVKTVEVEVVKTVEVVKEQVITQMVEGEPVEVVITTTPAPTPDTSQDPVNLRFTTWTSRETQLDLLNGLAAEYTAMHPNVTIQIDSIPSSEYIQKVSIQLAGGDPPDAGWMFETAAANWVKAGALADLAPSLHSYPDYDYDDISSKALAFWVRDEAVYGVPFSTSPVFVLYNADLFEAAGLDTPDVMMQNNEWTFENFAKAAKAIQDIAPEGTYGFSRDSARSFYTGSGPTYTLTPIIRGYGGEFWSDDFTTCMLNQPEAVQGIQLFQDMLLVDQSVVPPGETVAFITGNSGLAFSQLSGVGALSDATFEWGIVPLPAGPAGSAPSIGQAALVAFKAGENVEWAQDFVAFLTTKETVTKFAEFWPPARESVLNTDVIASNNPSLTPEQIQASITDSIINGKVVSSHPDYAKIQLTLLPFMDQLWVPGADVQDIMNQACDALSPYFSE